MGDPYKTFWRLYKSRLDEEMERAASRGHSQGISQGITQGEERSSLTHVRNLMSSMKLTAAQAMDALCIPESERGNLLAKL